MLHYYPRHVLSINMLLLGFNWEGDKSVKKRRFRFSGAVDCNKTASNLQWTGNSVHLKSDDDIWRVAVGCRKCVSLLEVRKMAYELVFC